MTKLQNSLDISQPIGYSSTAKWSYISLIYSVFYFLPLVVSERHYSVELILLIIATYLVFISLFFVTVFRFGKAALLPIWAIIALAFIASSYHTGCNIFFGYAAFFSGYYFKSRQANGLFAANLVVQLLSAYCFTDFSVYFVFPALAITLGLHLYGHFSRREVLHQLQQQQQSQDIENLAAIAERERIARDMHDLLGHSLSSLALKSELAYKLIDRNDLAQARDEISQVAELSRQTLAQVREAVTGLQQQDLATGLNALINQLEHLGFVCSLHFAISPLPAKHEAALALICKEWVTNIMRHSTGKNVSLSLTQQAQSIELAISDDGNISAINPGNGINGIKARVKELAGTCTVKTESGVSLSVQLPFAEVVDKGD